MKKCLLTLMVALMACMSMQAQYVVSDKYNLWFEGTDNEVTTRKTVWCEEDYQDLWNGCYVRLTNGRVYVKSGSSTIVYGDEIASIPSKRQAIRYLTC